MARFLTQVLTLASFNGHKKVVEILIAAGAESNAVVPITTNNIVYQVFLRATDTRFWRILSSVFSHRDAIAEVRGNGVDDFEEEGKATDQLFWFGQISALQAVLAGTWTEHQPEDFFFTPRQESEWEKGPVSDHESIEHSQAASRSWGQSQ